MQDLYKYFITGSIGTMQVYPTGKIQVVDSKATDDYRFGYKRTITGNLTFTGNAFNFLYTLEKTVYRCDPIAISISKLCGGVYIDDWAQGQLMLNNGTWDVDACTVQITIDALDKYTCFDGNKDTDVNLFDYVPLSQRQTVNTIQGTIESYVYTRNPLKSPNDTTHTTAGKWLNYKLVANDTTNIYSDYYARINLSGQYMFPMIYGTPAAVSGSNVYGWNCFGIDTASMLSNGMKLQDVLQGVISNWCSGLILKSNFFQWNPDTASTINYVTGAASKILNLVLFQKSDVKRAGESDIAIEATTTFGKLINNICILFNCNWDITDDGYFIIEHVSWYQKNRGLNLTDTQYAVYTKMSNKYSYDSDNTPSTEKFTAMEAAGKDFVGLPITYTGNCVVQDTTNSDNEKDYAADIITTDLFYVMMNSDSGNSSVSDDGFVLVACDGEDRIISMASILYNHSDLEASMTISGPFTAINNDVLLNWGCWLNNYLSWASLHQEFHRYNRVLKHGNMNGNLTEFFTTVPNKKQNDLNIPLCCGDIFDPVDLVETVIGQNGNVASATFDLSTQMLKLSLMFQQDDNLSGVLGPLANNDTASTPAGAQITVDVAANDYSPDGTIDPATIVIVTQPANGSAIANSDGTITYTPNTGYLGGTEIISYTIQDSNNNTSNVATLTITVLTAPVANSDTYNTLKNVQLAIPAPGILANDAGTNIQAQPYGGATAQGGTIVIGTAGNITYTPPTDFTGDDTCNYTIVDSNGLTSTGTITITVRERQTVYIKQDVGEIDTDITTTCSGVANTVVGTQRTGTLTISFFEDEDCTIPLDMNGYNLPVIVTDVYTDNLNHDNGQDNSYNQIINSGTTAVIANSYPIEYRYYGCNSSVLILWYQEDYSIVPSDDYVLK